MPLYGVSQSGFNGPPNEGLNLALLIPGDGPYFLFNAETLTPPQASVAFARGLGPNGQKGPIVFTISYASSPTAVLVIQGADTDLDADYITLSTSTNVQNDFYTDLGLFSFYRAKLVSQSGGGAVTVKAEG